MYKTIFQSVPVLDAAKSNSLIAKSKNYSLQK
jgi:hypothetical protein